MYIDALMHGGFVYVSCDLCSARSKAVWTSYDYGIPDEPYLLAGEVNDIALNKAKFAWNNRV